MRICLFLVCTLMACLLTAQKTYLFCGKLINTRTGTIGLEMTVIVEKNKIIDVQKGYVAAGTNDKQVDLKNIRLCPG